MRSSLRQRSTGPSYQYLINNVTVNVRSPECVGLEILSIGPGDASSAWSANLLEFVPLILVEPLVVSQFFWQNGGTVNGNTDVGIYSFDGQTKYGSAGSTANSGTGQIQVVNVTDFQLPPNVRLWMAIGSDSGTQTYTRSALAISGMDFIGIAQQAAGWSSGLPTTITPATPTLANVPNFGFTGASVI